MCRLECFIIIIIVIIVITIIISIIITIIITIVSANANTFVCVINALIDYDIVGCAE